VGRQQVFRFDQTRFLAIRYERAFVESGGTPCLHLPSAKRGPKKN